MAGHIFLLNNKYRIVKEIGKGGSSRVYLCEDVILHKMWAVKKIDKSIKDRDNGIYFLSKLSHPSIPRVVERFSDDVNNYIVTDYIEGVTLAEKTREEKLKYREVLRVTSDLCGILSYLHGLDPPVIFRDLKPGNIIIGNDRRTHIVDFDTVYIPDDKKCSPYVYTKGFSPPEFRSEKCFPESDIYSLGKVIAAVSDDAAKRKLRGVIRKACAKRPEDRYHSAEEIKKELSFAMLVLSGRRGMLLTGVALFLVLVFLLLVRDISERAVPETPEIAEEAEPSDEAETVEEAEPAEVPETPEEPEPAEDSVPPEVSEPMEETAPPEEPAPPDDPKIPEQTYGSGGMTETEVLLDTGRMYFDRYLENGGEADLKNAEEILSRAFEVSDEAGMIHSAGCMLAFLYRLAGEYESAAEVYEQVLEHLDEASGSASEQQTNTSAGYAGQQADEYELDTLLSYGYMTVVEMKDADKGRPILERIGKVPGGAKCPGYMKLEKLLGKLPGPEEQ